MWLALWRTAELKAGVHSFQPLAINIKVTKYPNPMYSKWCSAFCFIKFHKALGIKAAFKKEGWSTHDITFSAFSSFQGSQSTWKNTNPHYSCDTATQVLLMPNSQYSAENPVHHSYWVDSKVTHWINHINQTQLKWSLWTQTLDWW